MKRNKMTAAICGIALLCISCNRIDLPCDGSIRFSVVETQSKAAMSETKTVGNFLVSAYGNGTGFLFFENMVTVASGSSKIVTGYYWPTWNLDFYATFPVVQGQKIEFDSSSKSASVKYSNLDGSQDFVAATSINTSSTSEVALTFRHVLSNFAKLSLSGSIENATFYVNSAKLSLPSSARYNYGSSSWSGLENIAEKSFACPSMIMGMNTQTAEENYSLVPGKYDLTVEYNVIANGFSHTYVKTAEVNFLQGHKTTVKGVLTNDLSPVRFTVTVEDWEQDTEEIVL